MSALPDLLRDELERKGWSLRELERSSRESAEILSEQLGMPIERGISISTLSNMGDPARQVEPDLKTLRLLGMALKRPLRIFLLAMGYDPDSYEALSDPRKRTLAMIEAAPDDTLRLIDRLLELSPEHKQAVAAFMDYLSGAKK